MNMWVMAEGGKRVQRVGNVVMRDDACVHIYWRAGNAVP